MDIDSFDLSTLFSQNELQLNVLEKVLLPQPVPLLQQLKNKCDSLEFENNNLLEKISNMELQLSNISQKNNNLKENFLTVHKYFLLEIEKRDLEIKTLQERCLSPQRKKLKISSNDFNISINNNICNSLNKSMNYLVSKSDCLMTDVFTTISQINMSTDIPIHNINIKKSNQTLYDYNNFSCTNFVINEKSLIMDTLNNTCHDINIPYSTTKNTLCISNNSYDHNSIISNSLHNYSLPISQAPYMNNVINNSTDKLIQHKLQNQSNNQLNIMSYNDHLFSTIANKSINSFETSNLNCSNYMPISHTIQSKDISLNSEKPTNNDLFVKNSKCGLNSITKQNIKKIDSANLVNCSKLTQNINCETYLNIDTIINPHLGINPTTLNICNKKNSHDDSVVETEHIINGSSIMSALSDKKISKMSTSENKNLLNSEIKQIIQNESAEYSKDLNIKSLVPEKKKECMKTNDCSLNQTQEHKYNKKIDIADYRKLNRLKKAILINTNCSNVNPIVTKINEIMNTDKTSNISINENQFESKITNSSKLRDPRLSLQGNKKINELNKVETLQSVLSLKDNKENMSTILKDNFYVKTDSKVNIESTKNELMNASINEEIIKNISSDDNKLYFTNTASYINQFQTPTTDNNKLQMIDITSESNKTTSSIASLSSILQITNNILTDSKKLKISNIELDSNKLQISNNISPNNKIQIFKDITKSSTNKNKKVINLSDEDRLKVYKTLSIKKTLIRNIDFAKDKKRNKYQSGISPNSCFNSASLNQNNTLNNKEININYSTHSTELDISNSKSIPPEMSVYTRRMIASIEKRKILAKENQNMISVCNTSFPNKNHVTQTLETENFDTLNKDLKNELNKTTIPILSLTESPVDKKSDFTKVKDLKYTEDTDISINKSLTKNIDQLKGLKVDKDFKFQVSSSSKSKLSPCKASDLKKLNDIDFVKNSTPVPNKKKNSVSKKSSTPEKNKLYTTLFNETKRSTRLQNRNKKVNDLVDKNEIHIELSKNNLHNSNSENVINSKSLDQHEKNIVKETNSSKLNRVKRIKNVNGSNESLENYDLITSITNSMVHPALDTPLDNSENKNIKMVQDSTLINKHNEFEKSELTYVKNKNCIIDYIDQDQQPLSLTKIDNKSSKNISRLNKSITLNDNDKSCINNIAMYNTDEHNISYINEVALASANITTDDYNIGSKNLENISLQKCTISNDLNDLKEVNVVSLSSNSFKLIGNNKDSEILSNASIDKDMITILPLSPQLPANFSYNSSSLVTTTVDSSLMNTMEVSSNISCSKNNLFSRIDKTVNSSIVNLKTDVSKKKLDLRIATKHLPSEIQDYLEESLPEDDNEEVASNCSEVSFCSTCSENSNSSDDVFNDDLYPKEDSTFNNKILNNSVMNSNNLPVIKENKINDSELEQDSEDEPEILTSDEDFVEELDSQDISDSISCFEGSEICSDIEDLYDIAIVNDEKDNMAKVDREKVDHVEVGICNDDFDYDSILTGVENYDLDNLKQLEAKHSEPSSYVQTSKSFIHSEEESLNKETSPNEGTVLAISTVFPDENGFSLSGEVEDGELNSNSDQEFKKDIKIESKLIKSNQSNKGLRNTKDLRNKLTRKRSFSDGSKRTFNNDLSYSKNKEEYFERHQERKRRRPSKRNESPIRSNKSHIDNRIKSKDQHLNHRSRSRRLSKESGDGRQVELHRRRKNDSRCYNRTSRYRD